MKSHRILYLLPLFFSSLFAQTDEERLAEIERKLDQISMQSNWGTFGASTAPAYPALNGSGLYIMGDYIYWRTYENGVFNFTSSKRVDDRFFVSETELPNNVAVLR